jgi:hypothetical protein
MITRTALLLVACIILMLSQSGCRSAVAQSEPDSVDLNATTTVRVRNEVLRLRTKAIGMNLGGSSFWDSSLVLNNLAYRNPGFEGMLYQSTVRCQSGSATTCADENRSAAWPAGFWSGAEYEVIYGTARGRKGTVALWTNAKNGGGPVLTFADSGKAPAAGDYLILRKQFVGNAERGWWTHLDGGAQLSTELVDLAPDTPGKQALRMSATGPGQSAAVYSYFDAGDHPFIRLKGRYQVSFRAKRISGAVNLHVSVQRGARSFLSKPLPLTNNWRRYALPFEALESTEMTGSVRLAFEAVENTVLLDDVAFEQIDRDPTNQTALRDPVVKALREFHPGLLRLWVGQLGDSIDNMTAPPGGRKLSGYSAGAVQADQSELGLPEFLELCHVVGAEPWIVVPIVISPKEAMDLMEYLAGPATSAYGGRRAAQGQAAPWTSLFERIHLEFGNEAWNETFRGGTILDPKAYGTRASEIFSSMRNSPSFRADRFDLVLGGQNDWSERNQEIQNACSSNDSFAIAPYQMYNVDEFADNEDLFGPLFAEPEMSVTKGLVAKNQHAIQNSRHAVPLSVYELNLSTFGGSISQEGLDRLIPSLGSGIAVADHSLLMMERQGITNVLLWNLGQSSFQRNDGKSARLFGTVVDMGITDRRRPQFLATELLNEVLGGQMLRTEHSGSDPVWQQAKMNGVELDRAHYIHSFAFRDGSKRSLVLFNLHRTLALPVSIEGDLAPTGDVLLQMLSAESPAANNERTEAVKISSRQLAGFHSGDVLRLPPSSLTILTSGAPSTAIQPTPVLRTER